MTTNETYDIGLNDTPPIIQGSTFSLPFTMENIFANGGAGCTIRASLRKTYDTATSYSFTAEISTTTAETLSCLLSLSATASAAIPAGGYVYDCEIEDATGFVIKPLRGKAIILPEVTR